MKNDEKTKYTNMPLNIHMFYDKIFVESYTKDVKALDNNSRYTDTNPDIPNFNSRQEMDIIRQNEDIERKARLKRAAALRRQEIIRQKKLKQIKETVTAWAILIFIVISVIAIIVGIFSSSKDDGKGKGKDNKASSEILTAYSDFSNASYTFSGEGDISLFDSYIQDTTAFSDYFAYPSYYHIISQSSSYISSDTAASFRNTVRDCPQFSNGYIWSSTENMRYPLTGGYLYDTNASYICAVGDICQWNRGADFLYSIDETVSGSKDISNGMTVLAKVEKAADYFFDKNDLNGGGIRYNDNDCLAYILTPANNGLSGSDPSNIFHNHAFGYLDLYNNILFNKAMVSLDKLYTTLGDTAKAGYYKNIAAKNRAAIREKFYNKSLGRFVGYIDADGKVHDSGFTAVNLFAVDAGIAEKEVSDKIFSWIDGETKINTDTASSGKIFKDKSLPIFNTVCALEEGWFDKDGTSPYYGSANFGKYSSNGGASFASGYFNIGARSSFGTQKKLKSGIGKFADALEGYPSGTGEDLFALSGAYLSAKELLGIDTDGEILYFCPILSQSSDIGAKNISFGGNVYGFNAFGNKIIIRASINTAVKIKVGSYDEGTEFTLSVIEGENVSSTETVKADKDGFVSVYKRFGSGSFILLEKQEQKKK